MNELMSRSVRELKGTPLLYTSLTEQAQPGAKEAKNYLGALFNLLLSYSEDERELVRIGDLNLNFIVLGLISSMLFNALTDQEIELELRRQNTEGGLTELLERRLIFLNAIPEDERFLRLSDDGEAINYVQLEIERAQRVLEHIRSYDNAS